VLGGDAGASRDQRALDAAAARAGVDRARTAIDPGIGFGKRGEQNAEILARLRELARLDAPLLVGPSRKHFLAQTSDAATQFATAAAVTAAILAGVHIVRVHDVAEMRGAVSVADAVVRNTPQG
jgi:dihydropteroate synthase